MEVVLLESRISHTYLEQPKDVDFYADVFNYLRAAALGELESQALIRDIAREVAA
ncbi:Scr1 family TA system antitoxin-like transcriptional regulator [Streptomyces sp. BRA346]|uniref:Scr1 family TA system antitoxin-like transcriptional regulator n=1 Tax=Streptomyces sp. BRA346 TaxID=2878199 RepID=UPI0040628E66